MKILSGPTLIFIVRIIHTLPTLLPEVPEGLKECLKVSGRAATPALPETIYHKFYGGLVHLRSSYIIHHR